MTSYSRLVALGILAPALLWAKPDTGESAHYRTVRERVGEGGQVFVYVDIDGYFTQLGRELTTDVAAAAGDEPALALWKQDYAALAAQLGLAQVKAVGLSARQLGPDRFANKIYLHIPEGRQGLLRVFGGAAHPFASAKLAPADTDLFIESEFDLAALYATAHDLLQRFDPELAAQFPGAALVDPAKPEGAALAAFLKAQGRLTAIVRLAGDTPLAPDSAFKHDILLSLDVCGPQLLALLRAQHPELKESKTADGRTLYTTAASPDAPFQPVVTVDGSAIYIATGAAFLQECLDRKTGLPQAPAFTQALAATTQQGNSIAYASPRLFAVLSDLIGSLPQMPGADSSFKAIVQSLHTRLANMKAPAVSVVSNLPDGVLLHSVGPTSLRESLPLLGLATPDLAGNILRVALPSLVTDRRQAAAVARQGDAIRANLAKISAAAQARFAAEPELEEIGFADLLEKAPELAQLTPVADEEYTGVTIRRDRDSIELSAPNGASATYNRPLTDTERERIQQNLARFDEAAAFYFGAHPDETSMPASEAYGTGSPLTETPDSVVGESYDLGIGREDESLSITTPGGTTVTHRRVPGLRWTVLKRRAQQTEAVRRNLATFHAAATEYLAAHPDESYVCGYELFGEDRDRPELPAVAGESYSSVRLNRGSAVVSFEAPGIGAVVFEAELPAEQAAAIRENLRKLAQTAAGYFAKNPGETLVVGGELFAAGAEKPTAVAGEDYETLVVERGATSLTIALPDGRKVTADKL